MRPKSRSDLVASALRAKIQRGQPPVGSKLPSEQMIALTYKVSRTVVREAVARLKSDGLVETRPGTAARVRSADPGQARLLSMPTSIGGLMGFLEVRCAIESEMAALAAVRRSDAHCVAIKNALAAIDRSTRSGGTGVQEDLLFHLAIGEATSNSYWSQFVRLFAEPLRSAISVTRANEARRIDFASAVAEEHQKICQAIVDRNSDAARQAVIVHLSNAAARISQADDQFWEQEGGELARCWAEQGKFASHPGTAGQQAGDDDLLTADLA